MCNGNTIYMHATLPFRQAKSGYNALPMLPWWAKQQHTLLGMITAAQQDSPMNYRRAQGARLRVGIHQTSQAASKDIVGKVTTASRRRFPISGEGAMHAGSRKGI
jgi:hypothetical protein